MANKIDMYRGLAENCRRNATAAPSFEQLTKWLNMAVQWETSADYTESFRLNLPRLPGAYD